MNDVEAMRSLAEPQEGKASFPLGANTFQLLQFNSWVKISTGWYSTHWWPTESCSRAANQEQAAYEEVVIVLYLQSLQGFPLKDTDDSLDVFRNPAVQFWHAYKKCSIQYLCSGKKHLSGIPPFFFWFTRTIILPIIAPHIWAFSFFSFFVYNFWMVFVKCLN